MTPGGPTAMTDDKKAGDRIAKVMARAGIASRRDAEKMVLEGRVAVNGVKAPNPALNVLPSDKVTLDGKPIDAPQPARLWLYYKPLGLVTSNKDEKGRQTVFDTMPAEMPRVMSVGRLDLNSEGLLLLTNDGELKRKLELPSTGWLRKYRVRVNGRPNDATFDPLRRGVTVEAETFQPMDISLDRQQGANAWLTVGLREGKNREIRRAMGEVGLTVNRLIRVSYGPFRLNTMKPGDVVEVKQRVLRDQLGTGATDDAGEDDKPARKPRAPRRGDAPGRGPRPAGDASGSRAFKPRSKSQGTGPGAEDKAFKPRRPRDDRGAEGGKPFKPREDRDGAKSGKPFKSRTRPDSAKTGTGRNAPDDRRGPRTDGKFGQSGSGPRKRDPAGRK